jgi:hypothetical protein
MLGRLAARSSDGQTQQRGLFEVAICLQLGGLGVCLGLTNHAGALGRGIGHHPALLGLGLHR